MSLMSFLDDVRHLYFLESEGVEEKELTAARCELAADVFQYVLQDERFVDNTPENSEFTPENYHDASTLLFLMIDDELGHDEADEILVSDTLSDIASHWGCYDWSDILGY